MSDDTAPQGPGPRKAPPPGLSGRIAALFIASPLTPLILIASILAGALALAVLPREEEPQISVPMVDIMIQADGLKAEDAVELVTKPLEDIVQGIDGVEHVYSRTRDDRVVATVRFEVGTEEDAAILRVHENVRAHYDRMPLGIPEPLIVGRGIDDVAIVVLTLTPRADLAARWSPAELYRVAEELRFEIAKIEDVGATYLVGGAPMEIRVEPDPERLALYGIALNRVIEKTEAANRAFVAGTVRGRDRAQEVVAGQTLRHLDDIGQLTLTSADGRPVYLKDVARVHLAPAETDHLVWHLEADEGSGLSRRPAVSVAFAKRAGANAVPLAETIVERAENLRPRLIPDGLEMHVTRDYGETADEKARELLFHLLGATATIVVIIWLAIGWRPAAVVAAVIPATILLTFFASLLMGFTINRVSLFALIFAIGILVDDAIVVVENVVRHWRMDDGRTRRRAALDAVAEVGNPTIVATLTIIAALLPMAFVSGMMGPYMSPIPANASAAMVFSYLVAVIVTPWLLVKLYARAPAGAGGGTRAESGGLPGRIYLAVARPILASRPRAWAFLILVGLGTLASLMLFATRDVTVKLLPFDNKSELQVLVDLPEGSSLAATDRALVRAAQAIADLPELVSIQAHAGTAAPFNFNGLVRHFFLRESPELGDLQVNLVHKSERDRQSHAIALDIRERLAGVAFPPGTTVQVVEVPPGPPVFATLLAEVYGPDRAARAEAAALVEDAFRAVPFVKDVDTSLGAAPERLRIAISQEDLEFHGVEESALYDTLDALLGGVAVGYSHRGDGANPLEIVVGPPKADLVRSERLFATPVPGARGLVELGELVDVRGEPASRPIFRRDGRFAVMISAELAGDFEAPIYGMLAVEDALRAAGGAAAGLPVRYAGQPVDESRPSLLWDGEWEVTLVTFRDMGAAFAVALAGIYLLVVAQFGSFKLPLVILTPVPLTLMGIMLGHWALDAAFTATSMIGFIALAGIMVRNSILLVDFIRAARARGAELTEALLEAGAVRFRPIFLTAVTAVVGAAFILLDPIFQGLAISLVFGLASSTALTVLVIPCLYRVLRR